MANATRSARRIAFASSGMASRDCSRSQPVGRESGQHAQAVRQADGFNSVWSSGRKRYAARRGRRPRWQARLLDQAADQIGRIGGHDQQDRERSDGNTALGQR